MSVYQYSSKSYFTNISQFLHHLTFAQNQPVPLKWLKHLVLVHFGLRSSQDLNAEIQRFPMSTSGLHLARRLCTSLLEDNIPSSTLIVLKIVLPSKTMNLPNYRVTNFEQIKQAFSSIQKNYFDPANELWLCKSYITDSKSNLGGRILYRLDSRFSNEIIEIIWNTSPRMIDESGRSGFPHLIAYRPPGSLSFSVENLYIPSASKEAKQERQLLRDFRIVLLNLYKYREQICNFNELLYESNVKELVLEFKLDLGRFKFIDWDTDLDVGIAARMINS